MKTGVLIRPMQEADIHSLAFTHCPPWKTPLKLLEKWTHYYEEQQAAIRTVGIVERKGHLLGYGSLLLQSKYPYFATLPEIHDLWIFEEHRKKGLATQLIGWLEDLAREKGFSEIGIGVGLYADYGSAQRLYARLGYIPDGHGITYQHKPAVAGESYPLDDELILWLTKPLKPSGTSCTA